MGFSLVLILSSFIIFNRDYCNSDARFVFSIAHELAHLLLYSSVDKESALKKSVIDRADEQADSFAAAFLLPEKEFPNEKVTSSIH